MDVSGVLKYASEKGMALDGFELQKMFPEKTNWHELESAGDVMSPTWLLLKLQFRRFILSIVHYLLHGYASAPHIWLSPWGSLAKAIFGYPDTPMHYAERKCSTKELLSIVQGPECIAVALKYVDAQVPFLEDPPEEKKLADGSVVRVSQRQLDEHQRICEAKIEKYWKGRLDALEKLFEDAACVAEWAVMTPSIKRVIIFELSGQFATNSKEAFEVVQNRLATIPVPLQRDMICGFTGSPITTTDMQLIWADASQPPDTEPDLLIAFDGVLNGYPLWAIGEAQVFVPSRRQLLDSSGVNLLDFIEGVKFYASKSAEDALQNQVES